MTAKSSVDSVRMEMIADMQIPLPDPEEQNTITRAILDTDCLIKKIEQLIKKKKNIKQGAMQELLSCKRRLAGFTSEWDRIKLGEIAEIKDGTHQTPKYVEAGISFYSVENVTRDDFKNTKFISKEEHKLLTKNYRIEKENILMTRIGSIGDCKYVDWDVDASFYVSLALLKIKNGFFPQFICHFSKTEFFKKEMELNSLQSAIPKKINLGQISNVQMMIPREIKEQATIAQVLSNMDSEIDKLESQLAKYKNIKQGMMQKLLTGKIRLIKK